MRKYLAVCVAPAFLLFTASLLAQNTGSYGRQSSSSSSSTQQDNYPSGSQSTQSDMGSKSGQSSMDHQGKKHTVEGCIVREQTDYFLVPKSGTPVRLNAGASGDLSQHVGHRVKVRGNETAAGNAGGAQSSATAETAGTAGTAASSSTNTMGSASGAPGAVSENPNKTTNPQPGEPSTEANSQGASTGSSMGSSSGNGDLRNAATQEIVVDKLTMVSESCPANWNPTYYSGSK